MESHRKQPNERKAYFKSPESKEDFELAKAQHADCLNDPEYDAQAYLKYNLQRMEFVQRKDNVPVAALLQLALRTYAHSAEDSLTERAALKDIMVFDTADIRFDSQVQQQQALNRYLKKKQKFVDGECDASEAMQCQAENVFKANKLCALNIFLVSVRDLGCTEKISPEQKRIAECQEFLISPDYTQSKLSLVADYGNREQTDEEIASDIISYSSACAALEVERIETGRDNTDKRIQTTLKYHMNSADKTPTNDRTFNDIYKFHRSHPDKVMHQLEIAERGSREASAALHKNFMAGEIDKMNMVHETAKEIVRFQRLDVLTQTVNSMGMAL